VGVLVDGAPAMCEPAPAPLAGGAPVVPPLDDGFPPEPAPGLVPPVPAEGPRWLPEPGGGV